MLAQFIELLQEHRHELQLFERSSNALDKFYDLLKVGSAYTELRSVAKLAKLSWPSNRIDSLH